MAPRTLLRTAVTLFGLAMFAGTGSVTAQELRPVREILMVCSGCHNPEPGTLPPTEVQRIPRLGGQQPDYLRAALEAYRTRMRDHFYMRGMAAGLRGTELDAAVRYLSVADPSAGSRSPATSTVPPAALRCMACHGSGTQAPATPGTPRLAGQHAPYLEAAFLGYANGTRSHDVMSSQAKAADGKPSLSEAELREVAAWFSRQNGLVPR